MKNDRIFRNRYLFLMDIVGFCAAYWMTALLAVSSGNYGEFMWAFLPPFVCSSVIFVLIEYAFGIYRVLWRYCSIADMTTLALSGVSGFVATVAIFILYDLFALKYMPIGYVKIALCYGFFAMSAVVFIRAAVCILFRYTQHKKNLAGKKLKRILIVGAGQAATMVISDISHNVNLEYEIVGLIDDDVKKKNYTISGYPVMGGRGDIVNICRDYKVNEILIAMPSVAAAQRKEIIDICGETSCKIKTIPSIDQAIGNGKITMRDIEIDDLLARKENILDSSEIEGYISGRVVMVTGGGGSIGSALCRQIMRFKPERLVILDIYENNAYDIQMELNEKYPDMRPDVVIASIRDMDRLKMVFEEYRPSIVFHAAAHKHVPLMEDNPGEAIRNNVLGTYNVARCADMYGIKKFVMISTDKAVNPINIMGASKRMCEMIVQAMQGVSQTEFVSVRFGNVLGSNGSVVPLFKRQIQSGGPVTVTHRDITRFFMTIPEAAQLVLQAGAYAKGGEIFVLDMGDPVRIYDLAKNVIRLAGYKPGVDIEIKEVGLRPGEKLYEELMMNEEGLIKTKNNKIFIGHQAEVDIEDIKEKIKMLEEAADSQDKDKIRAALHAAVPSFKEPQKAVSVS